MQQNENDMNIDIEKLFDEIQDWPEALENIVLCKEDYDCLVAKIQSVKDHNPRLDELLRRLAPWE